MIPLTPADKSQLTRELTDPDNSPFLNALIRQIVHQSTTLADVHYGLSVAAKAIKTANGRVAERIEQSRTIP